ncbi:E3 ubiquitin-protein ligase [Sarcoptes scabiei]|nr:E3 ubiquitin-protein ligase [Sarcoptes scabiei]
MNQNLDRDRRSNQFNQINQDSVRKSFHHSIQPILCLNRLVEDFENLFQDHQTADVIFLVSQHSSSIDPNNNDRERMRCKNSLLDDRNGVKNHFENESKESATIENGIAYNQEIAFYAHRLILYARYGIDCSIEMVLVQRRFHLIKPTMGVIWIWKEDQNT